MNERTDEQKEKHHLRNAATTAGIIDGTACNAILALSTIGHYVYTYTYTSYRVSINESLCMFVYIQTNSMKPDISCMNGGPTTQPDTILLCR